MTVRVLIVDDSGFFRRRLAEIFATDARLQVVGMAANGAEAVELAARLNPDVITMDVEMPVMDGITAVRRIMERRATPILMLSSLTTEGAQATLDALDAGAVDFLPKRLEEISSDKEHVNQQLCLRVLLLGRRGLAMAVKQRTSAAAPKTVPAPAPVRAAGTRLRTRCRVLAIGTSTGGPAALQEILKALPADFPLPILLVQHMPAAFTGPFAQRLDRVCQITVKEAAEGDALLPGRALLAPGGRQMRVENHAGQSVVRITDPEAGQTYKPSVDVTFSSLAQVYGGHVLAMILTGMGADGREGTRLLKAQGAVVWAQDEQSCVVYGMPHAVAQAGLVDQILPLSQIGAHLVQDV